MPRCFRCRAVFDTTLYSLLCKLAAVTPRAFSQIWLGMSAIHLFGTLSTVLPDITGPSNDPDLQRGVYNLLHRGTASARNSSPSLSTLQQSSTLDNVFHPRRSPKSSSLLSRLYGRSKDVCDTRPDFPLHVQPSCK